MNLIDHAAGLINENCLFPDVLTVALFRHHSDVVIVVTDDMGTGGRKAVQRVTKQIMLHV